MTEEEITLKEFLEQRIDGLEKAINLQALEYSRRLLELNHEKESIKEIQHKYVLQDTYDKQQHDIDAQLRLLNTFKDNVQGRIAAYPFLAFILSTIVTVILHFTTH